MSINLWPPEFQFFYIFSKIVFNYHRISWKSLKRFVIFLVILEKSMGSFEIRGQSYIHLNHLECHIWNSNFVGYLKWLAKLGLHWMGSVARAWLRHWPMKTAIYKRNSAHNFVLCNVIMYCKSGSLLHFELLKLKAN